VQYKETGNTTANYLTCS